MHTHSLVNGAQLPTPNRTRRGWPWEEVARSAAQVSVAATLGAADSTADAVAWARISIVTPSYNQAAFLEETIRSVLLQRYPNVEYIIMDGGSTDRSIQIIETYAPWLSHWSSGCDLGQSAAINTGFARATGHILTWLNSDDFLAPDALFKVASAFRDNPTAGAVVGIGHKLDRKRNKIYSPLPDSITAQTLLGWCEGGNFMQPACFFTKAAWAAAGPLRLDLNYCMDLALWLQIAKHHEFLVLHDELAYINTHAGAKTVKERPLMFAELALLIASQPGGWAYGKRLLFKKISEPRRSRSLRSAIRDRIVARLRRERTL